MFSTSSCRQFSFGEIKHATKNFDKSMVLGKGGEAKVYLAELYLLHTLTKVAVKHLHSNSIAFEDEVRIVSKIQHPNIVSLLGYCKESGHKVLVYEYMEKGCLADYIAKESRIYLPWLQRLKICIGAARGLRHLHTSTTDHPKGIIHRDVKPHNILVDSNWVGKLSDFGMFKLSEAGQLKSSMNTKLKGTAGFYAPEYIQYRRVTRKVDVYAFGVVLFKVLCHKMPWDRDESYDQRDDEDLGLWAKQNVNAKIKEEISERSLEAFTDIIKRSLRAKPLERPTMDEVVLELEKVLHFQEPENETKKLPTSIAPKNPRSRANQSESSTIDAREPDLGIARMFEEAEVPKDHSQKLQIQARSKQPTVSKLSGPFQPKDPSWQSLQSIEIQWQANPSGSSIIRHRGWNIEVPKDHSLTLEVGYNQPTVSTPLTFLPKDRRYIQTDNTVDYSYDVFINYKYETHTRNPNSMLLQEGLEEAGFRTFMQTSHEGPWRAEIDTIRNSMCAIVLITRNYTAYHTGLEELLYILKKCKRDSTFALVPVYLDVDPGDAIWYEKGDSGCALENHRSNFGRKINKWKAAMEEVWQSFEPYTLTRKKSVKKIVQAVKYHLEMAAQKLLSNQF